MAKRGVAMRVDKDLAQIIEDFAKLNDLSLREASKEVARDLKTRARKVQF